MENIEEISDLLCLMEEEDYITEAQRDKYEKTLDEIRSILTGIANLQKGR